MRPLILTQHSSGSVPFNILADMLGPDVHDPEKRAERLAQIEQAGDPFTDALFYTRRASHVHALVSRFVVDLNRERDRGGLNGVIKVTDFRGQPLYQKEFQFSEKRIEERLKRYYDPFHKTVNRMLAKPDIGYFIDGHSMSAVGPLIGPDSGKLRPAICVMTGGAFTGEMGSSHPSIPADLAQRVLEGLTKHFSDIVQDSDTPDAILLNDPFSAGGTIARLSDPGWAGAKPGFGIEFNRALFATEDADGWETPIRGRVGLLNERFQTFVEELNPHFEPLRTVT